MKYFDRNISGYRTNGILFLVQNEYKIFIIINEEMLRLFLIILMGLTLNQAVDLRKITCKPYFGEWDCWYNQTCGDKLYECKGEANDAPPFSALAFGWIIVGVVVGFISLVVLIGVIVACCVIKKVCCCRK